MTEAEQRRVSIETWHALAREGAGFSVTILLEGDSMRPLIRRGRDRVTLIPRTELPRRGDVVLFRAGKNRYVVHRVARLRAGKVQTLGDHCSAPDPWILPSDVLGTVIRVERSGKTLHLDTEIARRLGCAWMALLPVRRCWYGAEKLAARVFRKLTGKEDGRWKTGRKKDDRVC